MIGVRSLAGGATGELAQAVSKTVSEARQRVMGFMGRIVGESRASAMVHQLLAQHVPQVFGRAAQAGVAPLEQPDAAHHIG